MNIDETSTPFIRAESLHTYYGDSHILHGIDIEVGQGETVSLMGRNGMGKTTTLKSILGLVKPREGKIFIKGKESTKYRTEKVIRQGIAFVPEDRGIFPNLDVVENLTMAERKGPSGRDEWNLKKVLDVFPRLGERLSHMGNQLSGGEQQMLTIARALMTNPDLIILDEATEGLAPLIRQEIWSVIRHIKATGIASVIVDKDINALLPICDRNYIISKGNVVFDGKSKELLENPELHKQYLGV